MSTASNRIHDAIRESLHEALPQIGDIDFDAALTSDIGLDSVQIMDLVMEIEDRLDISIPIEVLAEVKTLNQLAGKLDPIAVGTPR
ncbi:MAG: acyl carrier protein [Wenzhouxiangellaceae bacterium]|nr:acyl carrier protein [Wenzhouxiangellaceae bacterium]